MKNAAQNFSKISICCGSLLISSGAYAISLCTDVEAVIFSCQIERRIVSVCASTEASNNKIQYRYGRPNQLELVYPDSPSSPTREFTSGQMTYSGGGGAWLRFKKAEFDYTIFTAVGRWGTGGRSIPVAGVAVRKNEREFANFPCTSEERSELGPLLFQRLRIPSDQKEADFEIPARFFGKEVNRQRSSSENATFSNRNEVQTQKELPAIDQGRSPERSPTSPAQALPAQVPPSTSQRAMTPPTIGQQISDKDAGLITEFTRYQPNCGGGGIGFWMPPSSNPSVVDAWQKAKTRQEEKQKECKKEENARNLVMINKMQDITNRSRNQILSNLEKSMKEWYEKNTMYRLSSMGLLQNQPGQQETSAIEALSKAKANGDPDADPTLQVLKLSISNSYSGTIKVKHVDSWFETKSVRCSAIIGWNNITQGNIGRFADMYKNITEEQISTAFEWKCDQIQ